MKQRRIPSHPAFKLEGRSQHFQSLWELELTPGEETAPRQHHESEGLIYLVQGRGCVRVAETEQTVDPGEVVLVPPRTDHVIANRSEALVRAITVESRLDLGEEDGDGEADPPLAVAPQELQGDEATRASLRSIDEVMEALPSAVDEARAIQSIVKLFDIGGELSEQIETTLGLDNADGTHALARVEKRIMTAVVDIAARYGRPSEGWPRG